MTSKAMALFLEFCKIPHASFHTEEMCMWLKDYAARHHLHVQEDNAKNLLLSKGLPRLCLQAHYDMVLVGQKVEPIEKDGFLCSIDSSLGADNGAALCAALCAFDSVENLELLITNDEEVGMLGTNALELRPKSKAMLNLDSEDLDEIIVGCAGGADVTFTFANLPLLQLEENLCVYEISTCGFHGGHSGIDIDKGHENAIVALAQFIQGLDDVYPISISGGTKRNAIAANAQARVLARGGLPQNEHFAVKQIIQNPPYRDCRKVLSFLTLPLLQGVQKKGALGVELSCNVGIIQDEGDVHIQAMARGNDTYELLAFIEQLHKASEGFGAEFGQSHFYPAWEREQGGRLLDITQHAFMSQQQNPTITTIHAGLECGILRNKLELDEILSIGPTIHNPHSKSERLELASFARFESILLEILKNY
ncbi:MAG: M20/M25/M40 family metallo-hydrolase [Helicobacter sp.]|nr:M20/M25/M40 family metallo-hydrolase [Helicobacter sp.]